MRWLKIAMVALGAGVLLTPTMSVAQDGAVTRAPRSGIPRSCQGVGPRSLREKNDRL